MEERYRNVMEILHKGERETPREEIEAKSNQRKQLHVDGDLEKLINEKKNLTLRSVTTKSQEVRNEYNVLKRKV